MSPHLLVLTPVQSLFPEAATITTVIPLWQQISRSAKPRLQLQPMPSPRFTAQPTPHSQFNIRVGRTATGNRLSIPSLQQELRLMLLLLSGLPLEASLFQEAATITTVSPMLQLISQSQKPHLQLPPMPRQSLMAMPTLHSQFNIRVGRTATANLFLIPAQQQAHP